MQTHKRIVDISRISSLEKDVYTTHLLSDDITLHLQNIFEQLDPNLLV